MARTKSLISGDLRGKIDNIVFKHYSYGTVVSKMPDMSRVKTSQRQQAERDFFAEAVAYAKGISRDPQKKEAYAKKHKLKKDKVVFNAAVQEFRKTNKKRYNEILLEVLSGKREVKKKRRR